jgi:hypothetical protein
MTLKVLFSECSSKLWTDVAAALAEKAGWRACYWTGGKAVEAEVLRLFPEAVFHVNVEAVRGLPAPACADLPLPALDPALLREMAFHESLALSMMDRMDTGYQFSHRERRSLYYRYLQYWSAVLDHFKPDLFITLISPHLGYDYVLYRLCLHRNIPTLMFERTALLGQVYPVRRFEDGSPAIRAQYRAALDAAAMPALELSAWAEDYIQKVTSASYEEAMPENLKRKFARLQQGPGRTVRLIQTAQSFFRPAPPNYLKERGQPMAKDSMPGWKWRLGKLLGNRRKRALLAHYEACADPALDLSQPYILVMLHYQPERTTSPMAGVFVDQWLMVDLLSKTAPAG